MLFNSIEFIIFLPIVFAIYWLTSSKRQLQNILIIIASYFFYGWWDWKFLILIAFTTLCSWISGPLIQNAKSTRTARTVLTANIILNIGILAIFKYYDFFAAEFADLFHIDGNKLLLNLILPVGISFYTFQALSYSIDVYRKNIIPTKDIAAFFAYISFFPQLVAGPIERSTNLLPQFLKSRHFDYSIATDGLRQILWGFFKKIVVADTCAVYVDAVFTSHADHSGSTLVLAAIFFTFQIYGDFSGYSDIAIGTAKLFGIKLMQNFKTPYFSRDIAEFWRRWHISLTTWFRDYIYIPLGGSRVSKVKVIRNTFIIFLVSGLWHGANWTFIAWGAFHAILFLPLIVTGKNRKYTNIVADNKLLPTFKECIQLLSTFLLVVVGWIIFRSESIGQAFEYFCGIFNSSLFSVPWLKNRETYMVIILSIIVMLTTEWLNRHNAHGLVMSSKLPRGVRYLIYTALAIIIIRFSGTPSAFIYFAF